VVEALAALTLIATAGAVVAAAATTSLRAVARGGVTARLTALAARELALLQARGAPECDEETDLAAAGLAGPVRRRARVTHREDGVAELRVEVASAGHTVALATRMLVPE
jgi:hypothetical protein